MDASEVRSSGIDAIYRERMEKTVVVTLPPEGKPYVRPDVVSLITSAVGESTVEAIGQRERNLQWEITFKSIDIKNNFLAKENLNVKGYAVRVSNIRRSTHRIRVFYVPFYVPTSLITQQLEKLGVTVHNAFVEKDKDSGLCTNVRNIVAECDNLETIPDRMNWDFDGMKGQALVNVTGRSPRCLRCNERGHKKYQCDAPYCKICRKVGHEESAECKSIKPSFAQMASRNPATKTLKDVEMEDFEESPVDEEPRPTTPSEGASAAWTAPATPPSVKEAESVLESSYTREDYPSITQYTTTEQQPLVEKTAAANSPSSVGELERGRASVRPTKRPAEGTLQEGPQDPTSTRRKTRPVLVTSSAGLSAQNRSPSSKRRGKTGQPLS